MMEGILVGINNLFFIFILHDIYTKAYSGDPQFDEGKFVPWSQVGFDTITLYCLPTLSINVCVCMCVCTWQTGKGGYFRKIYVFLDFKKIKSMVYLSEIYLAVERDLSMHGKLKCYQIMNFLWDSVKKKHFVQIFFVVIPLVCHLVLIPLNQLRAY